MKRLKRFSVLVAALAIVAAGAATEAAAKNNTGAVIGGIIAGAAIGAAVPSEMKHPNTVYVPAPPPKPPSPQTFTPKPGVVCYPAQRACYSDRGAYSANWTWKVYAK